MKKKDPFDELLMRCLEDGQAQTSDKKTAGELKTGSLVNCLTCNEVILMNYRYCPNCGEPTVDLSGDSKTGFNPLIMKKKLFRVTISDLDRDFCFNGQYFTRLNLKIENLTEDRLHVSLTFVDSVIISINGRQYSPLDSEDVDIPKMFESWFYIYPHAHRDGIMIFPEIPERIKSVYISCNPQNAEEEELFHFVIE
jgi:hypothetical protein